MGEECYWQAKWLLEWSKCINDKVKGEERNQVVEWQWSEYTVEKGTEKRSSEQPVTKHGDRELRHNPRGSQSVCCCCWAVCAPVIFTGVIFLPLLPQNHVQQEVLVSLKSLKDLPSAICYSELFILQIRFMISYHMKFYSALYQYKSDVTVFNLPSCSFFLRVCLTVSRPNFLNKV